MKLLEFIKGHKDWKELLKESPFFLNVKEENDYVLLKYNQFNSDFNNPIVKECRGIILKSIRNKDWVVVCHAFDKFFNYGEQYADNIDWSTARVQEKIDGTIMKLWYDDNSWKLSTNSCIDAYKTDLNINELLKVNCPFSTFGELFENAENYSDIKFDELNKDYTYIFELVSPYNKVVIEYPKIIINHIGTRNNITHQELEVDIGVIKPKEYKISTLEECVKAASNLPSNAEGYVVVDNNWNRIKVKNPIYLQLHRMISNNQLKTEDILNMLFENEQEEFLSYFPEYRESFNKVRLALINLKAHLENTYKKIKEDLSDSYTQKEFAFKVMSMDKANSNYYFCKEKGIDTDDWIQRLSKDSLVKKLTIKN